MRTAVVWSCLMIATIATRPAHAKPYVNDEFGFTVDPLGYTACPAPPTEHDDGVVILLDADSSHCDRTEDRNRINVYGDYNSAFEKSAKEEADSYCESSGGHVAAAPEHLQIDGRPSASCRVNYDDGWIDILVATQDGKWGNPGPGDDLDLNTAMYSYGVMLHTNAKRLHSDLQALRAVLKSTHIFSLPKAAGN